MTLGFAFLILLIFVVGIGSIVQTYYPNFISKETSDALSAITLGSIGILVSCGVVMVFLKLNNREGFQDKDIVARWKTIVSDNKFKEVCDLYAELYEKILKVEKGAPPDEVTDAQAREKTDKRFADLMKVKPIPCKLVLETLNLTTLDELFEALPTIPDTICQQTYETALACRSLLIESLNRVKQAEIQRTEAFEDVPLCSNEIAEKRRAAKEEATCKLPEELTTETKERIVDKKLDEIEFECKNLQRTDTLERILEDCKVYKDELKQKAIEAEGLSKKYDFRSGE